MSTKKANAKAKADRAKPKLRLTGRNDAAKVACTKGLATNMPKSQEWPQATEVQSALQLVTKGSDALEAQAKIVKDLRDQLAVQLSKLPALRHDWDVAVAKLLSTVEVHCGGSAEMVQGFGFEVRVRVQRGPQPAPADLTAKAGKDVGQVDAAWTKGSAHHGFVVQHATDRAAPATYSALEPSTKPHITLRGLPSGTTVYVRVAAVDPKAVPALGPWTEWASATVR